MSQFCSTFANFVNGELVGLILDILDSGQVQVTRNAAILFIQKLHSLSCYVNHTYCQKNSITVTIVLKPFNQNVQHHLCEDYN